MYGVSKIKPEHPDDGPINFSLSFCPLNEWKHLPIKLNNLLEIYEIKIPKIFERDEKEVQTKKLLSAKKEITLYDFLKIFLHEITWYGDPKMRNKKAKEIEDIGKKLDSGNEFLDRFDQTLLEWKEKELDDCLKSENYEMAIIIKQEIEFLREKIKKNK